MRYSSWGSRIPLLFGCIILLLWTGQGFAEEVSGCVKCHMDEDMLDGSLAVVKGKKSAMQSGAG